MDVRIFIILGPLCLAGILATDSQDRLKRQEDPPAPVKLEDIIPGIPNEDYPVLNDVPSLSFRCSSQQWPGYYADVETRCQVFHICQFNGRQDSFLCPNGSIFDQRYFVCVWWFNANCNDATRFYGLNADLFSDLMLQFQQKGSAASDIELIGAGTAQGSSSNSFRDAQNDIESINQNTINWQENQNSLGQDWAPSGQASEQGFVSSGQDWQPRARGSEQVNAGSQARQLPQKQQQYGEEVDSGVSQSWNSEPAVPSTESPPFEVIFSASPLQSEVSQWNQPESQSDLWTPGRPRIPPSSLPPASTPIPAISSTPQSQSWENSVSNVGNYGDRNPLPPPIRKPVPIPPAPPSPSKPSRPQYGEEEEDIQPPPAVFQTSSTPLPPPEEYFEPQQQNFENFQDQNFQDPAPINNFDSGVSEYGNIDQQEFTSHVADIPPPPPVFEPLPVYEGSQQEKNNEPNRISYGQEDPLDNGVISISVTDNPNDIKISYSPEIPTNSRPPPPQPTSSSAGRPPFSQTYNPSGSFIPVQQQPSQPESYNPSISEQSPEQFVPLIDDIPEDEISYQPVSGSRPRPSPPPVQQPGPSVGPIYQSTPSPIDYNPTSAHLVPSSSPKSSPRPQQPSIDYNPAPNPVPTSIPRPSPAPPQPIFVEETFIPSQSPRPVPLSPNEEIENSYQTSNQRRPYSQQGFISSTSRSQEFSSTSGPHIFSSTIRPPPPPPTLIASQSPPKSVSLKKKGKQFEDGFLVLIPMDNGAMVLPSPNFPLPKPEYLTIQKQKSNAPKNTQSFVSPQPIYVPSSSPAPASSPASFVSSTPFVTTPRPQVLTRKPPEYNEEIVNVTPSPEEIPVTVRPVFRPTSIPSSASTGYASEASSQSNIAIGGTDQSVSTATELDGIPLSHIKTLPEIEFALPNGDDSDSNFDIGDLPPPPEFLTTSGGNKEKGKQLMNVIRLHSSGPVQLIANGQEVSIPQVNTVEANQNRPLKGISPQQTHFLNVNSALGPNNNGNFREPHNNGNFQVQGTSFSQNLLNPNSQIPQQQGVPDAFLRNRPPQNLQQNGIQGNQLPLNNQNQNINQNNNNFNQNFPTAQQNNQFNRPVLNQFSNNQPLRQNNNNNLGNNEQFNRPSPPIFQGVNAPNQQFQNNQINNQQLRPGPNQQFQNNQINNQHLGSRPNQQFNNNGQHVNEGQFNRPVQQNNQMNGQNNQFLRPLQDIQHNDRPLQNINTLQNSQSFNNQNNFNLPSDIKINIPQNNNFVPSPGNNQLNNQFRNINPINQPTNNIENFQIFNNQNRPNNAGNFRPVNNQIQNNQNNFQPLNNEVRPNNNNQPIRQFQNDQPTRQNNNNQPIGQFQNNQQQNNFRPNGQANNEIQRPNQNTNGNEFRNGPPMSLELKKQIENQRQRELMKQHFREQQQLQVQKDNLEQNKQQQFQNQGNNRPTSEMLRSVFPSNALPRPPVNNVQQPINNQHHVNNNNQLPLNNQNSFNNNNQRPINNNNQQFLNNQNSFNNNQRPFNNNQHPLNNNQQPFNNNQLPFNNNQRPFNNNNNQMAVNNNLRPQNNNNNNFQQQNAFRNQAANFQQNIQPNMAFIRTNQQAFQQTNQGANLNGQFKQFQPNFNNNFNNLHQNNQFNRQNFQHNNQFNRANIQQNNQFNRPNMQQIIHSNMFRNMLPSEQQKPSIAQSAVSAEQLRVNMRKNQRTQQLSTNIFSTIPVFLNPNFQSPIGRMASPSLGRMGTSQFPFFYRIVRPHEPVIIRLPTHPHLSPRIEVPLQDSKNKNKKKPIEEPEPVQLASYEDDDED